MVVEMQSEDEKDEYVTEMQPEDEKDEYVRRDVTRRRERRVWS